MNSKLYSLICILAIFTLNKGIASEIKSVSIFKSQSNLTNIDDFLDHWFVPINHDEINMGYTKDVIWLKVSLDSTVNYDAKLLHFTKPIHDSLTVFCQKNGKWATSHAGLATKDSLFTFYSGYYFPLENISLQTPIYIRSKSVYAQDLNFDIVDKNFFYINEYQRRIIYGLLIGSILIIVLYNLFIGVSIKDVTYFYYAVVGVSSLLGQLSLLGIFNNHALADMTEGRNLFIIICVTSVKITGAIFIMKFLELSKYHKTAQKIMLAVMIFNIGQITITFILNKLGIITPYLLGAIGGVLFFISVGYAVFKAMKGGHKNAKYLLIAGGLIVLSVAVLGLKGLGIVSSNVFTNNFFWVASIMETFLLSLALAARYKQWQHDKNEAQKKLDFQQIDMDRIATDNVKRIEFKHDLVDDLKKIIKNESNLKKALQTLVFDYEQLLSAENKQDFLNSNANEINAEFKEKLNLTYPALTESEIEICGYVLIGLTNNEIAVCRSSNPIAVRSARYRIRKKMNLQKDQTISDGLKLLDKMDF